MEGAQGLGMGTELRQQIPNTQGIFNTISTIRYHALQEAREGVGQGPVFGDYLFQLINSCLNPWLYLLLLFQFCSLYPAWGQEISNKLCGAELLAGVKPQHELLHCKYSDLRAADISHFGVTICLSWITVNHYAFEVKNEVQFKRFVFPSNSFVPLLFRL